MPLDTAIPYLLSKGPSSHDRPFPQFIPRIQCTLLVITLRGGWCVQPRYPTLYMPQKHRSKASSSFLLHKRPEYIEYGVQTMQSIITKPFLHPHCKLCRGSARSLSLLFFYLVSSYSSPLQSSSSTIILIADLTKHTRATNSSTCADFPAVLHLFAPLGSCPGAPLWQKASRLLA
jgi:hypothetical protein